MIGGALEALWAEKGVAPGQVFGKGTHALNGLLRCGVCGGPFTIRLTRTDARGRLVRSVGCLRHQRHSEFCTNVGIVTLAAVEDALSVALIKHFSDFKLMVAHRQRFDRALAEYRQHQSADEQQATQDLAAAEAEIAKVGAGDFDGCRWRHDGGDAPGGGGHAG